MSRPAGRVRDRSVIDSGAAEVRRLLDLLAVTDLRPSPRVDALFHALVDTAAGLPACPDDPGLVERCRDICARGESLLEEHWAGLVLADPRALARFPYRRQYRRLVGWEWRLLRCALGRPPTRIVMAGSGPLPLTAITLASARPGVEIVCLDPDPAALARGSEVATAVLGGGHRMRFVEADAADYDHSGADVSLVAALAGATPAEKAAILVAAADARVIAARSVPADGRVLLYPRIADVVTEGVTGFAEWDPPRGVVNSLAIGQPARSPRPYTSGTASS